MIHHPVWKTELDALMNPASIAVIGATEKVGPGRNVIFNLLDLKYKGTIYPVNPSRDEVFGLKCYADIKDLPEIPEAVAIAVPAKLVVEALRGCADFGIGACTIFTSGFSEMGAEGQQMQLQMTEIAEKHRIAVCGPNCLGLLNIHDSVGLYSASVPPGIKAGPVAVLSQSGSMAIAMVQALKDLGISSIISCGNQAVLDISDYLYHYSRDPNTRVITAFIEGIADGRKFIDSVNECRKRGKVVVALKVGRSDIGMKAAQAHTAAIVGSHDIYEAAFKECGVLSVDDIDEMVQTVIALIQTRPLTMCEGIMLFAISGGQCGLVGDIASPLDLSFPKIGPKTREELTKNLPDYIHVDNPLDLAGVGSDNPEDYARAIRICADDPEVGLILISQDAPYGIGPSTKRHYTRISTAIIQAYDQTTKPLLVFSNHSTPFCEEVIGPLLEKGIPYLQGTKETLKAVRNLITNQRHRDGAQHNNRHEKTHICVEWEGVGDLLEKLALERLVLGERESKALLAMTGIPVTREVLCRTEDEVLQAATSIGCPVALKIDSPEIVHKTEAGGVALGLRSSEDIRSAYRHMLRTVAHKCLGAQIKGVLVQEMAPEGVDLLIGVHEDRQFGHVLVYGLGGIYVEVFKDANLGLIPLDKKRARELIAQSRSLPLLNKFRGREALDTEQLVDIMLRVSGFVERFGDRVAQIDLNPVRIGTCGVKVLDALMELKHR